MTRDYAAEMRAVIDTETGHGPYVSRVVAREIVEKLQANDADLLNGWLFSQAEQLVWTAINGRDRSARAHARSTGSRSAFAAAADEHDAGDSTSLGRFLGCRYVVEDGSRRPLADLTKADLTFVAESYEDRARQNAFEAAFFRALAKKVGRGTVADHFTEERIAALRGSLS